MPGRLKLWGTNVLIAVVLLLVVIEALPQSPPAVRSFVKPITRTVGLVDEKDAEVLSGLQPGQRVIVAGSPAIVEGSPVTTEAAGASGH